MFRYDKRGERYEVDEEEAKRIRNAMRMRNIELDREFAYSDDSNNYCPKCNMLLPSSGECDCGYVK